MLEFLAQMIGTLGATIISFTVNPIAPTSCSQRGDIQYCYYAGASESKKIIYFMHGFGNDVTGWTHNSVVGRIEEQWAKKSIVRPHIVTLSKNVWWYTERSQGTELSEFVRWFEASQIKASEGSISRVLYGDSMGGHNAYRWSLDEPQFFSKLALICPAFPRSFVDHPAASEGFPPWELLAQNLINEYYKKSTHPRFNPLKAKTADVPAVYLAVSNRDDFGFYAGGLALREVLKSQPQLNFIFEVQSVRHCEVDAVQLSEFLIN